VVQCYFRQRHEHPHPNGCADPTERQEAKGFIQGPTSSSFGLTSSCQCSRSNTINWYRWPERTSVSDRGHVYFGPRQPSQCSCVDHQEGRRVGAGGEVRQRTASELHRWCLALFELWSPGEHCYWKAEGSSQRQVSVWYLWYVFPVVAASSSAITHSFIQENTGTVTEDWVKMNGGSLGHNSETLSASHSAGATVCLFSPTDVYVEPWTDDRVRLVQPSTAPEWLKRATDRLHPCTSTSLYQTSLNLKSKEQSPSRSQSTSTNPPCGFVFSSTAVYSIFSNKQIIQSWVFDLTNIANPRAFPVGFDNNDHRSKPRSYIPEDPPLRLR
jgi:hypothetical protein